MLTHTCTSDLGSESNDMEELAKKGQEIIASQTAVFLHTVHVYVHVLKQRPSPLIEHCACTVMVGLCMCIYVCIHVYMYVCMSV